MNGYDDHDILINYTEGVSRFSGNEAVYREYLKKFKNDTYFAQLCAALELGDCNTAFRAAHSLKGLAGNLSLTALYKEADVITSSLRNKKEIALPEGSCQRLNWLYAATLEAIEKVLR